MSILKKLTKNTEILRLGKNTGPELVLSVSAKH